MIKRGYQEEHQFDEDAQPCLCTVCNGWFDLEDGAQHPRKENLIICEGCAVDIQQEIDREEEIEELQSQLNDSEYEVTSYRNQLIEKGVKLPKRICYCGSLRFIEKFKEVEYQSVIDGNIALLPCCMFVDIQREYGASSDYKIKADELHKRKIDICDEVFVLNVGGYIGDSTRSEIEYAKHIGKPIKYLEE